MVRSPFTRAILALEMTDRHAAIFQLLLSGMMAQAVALLVDPHSLYEHLKASFMRETLDQPAPIAAARPQLSGA